MERDEYDSAMNLMDTSQVGMLSSDANNNEPKMNRRHRSDVHRNNNNNNTIQ